MRNNYPKFTFKKIHPDTIVTQLEFLKSDKRAKSYEELKNGKIGLKQILLSVCHPEFRLLPNRNSGSPSGLPVRGRQLRKLTPNGYKRLVFSQTLYKLVFHSKLGVGWAFITYIKPNPLISKCSQSLNHPNTYSHTWAKICIYFF